jgi:hypothetical protein
MFSDERTGVGEMRSWDDELQTQMQRLEPHDAAAGTPAWRRTRKTQMTNLALAEQVLETWRIHDRINGGSELEN